MNIWSSTDVGKITFTNWSGKWSVLQITFPPPLPPPKKKPLTLQSYGPTLGLTQNQTNKQNR